LIQAQLTNDELSLILYNSLSDNGLSQSKESKFYEWLNDYKFLENVDSKSLLSRNHHIFFDKTFFKFLSIDEKKRKNNNSQI